MTRRLTQRETEQMVSRLVALIDTGQPMVEGLLAAGRDVASARLQTTFDQLAKSFSQGQDWKQAIENQRLPLSASLRAAIRVATSSHHPREVIACYAEHQSMRRAVIGQLWRTLRYPLAIGSLATLFSVLFVTFVVAELAALGAQMRWPLGDAWVVILWWSRHSWAWACIGGTIVILLITLRLLAGPAIWRSWVRRIPLVGPVRYWLSLAEWCRWVSLLTAHEVRLDEAFRLAAETATDAEVSAISRRAARAATDGQLLDAIIERDPAIPRSLLPFFRWGHKTSQYSEAFETAGRCLEQRLQDRLLLLQAVSSPLAFAYFGLVIVVSFGWLLVFSLQSARIY